MIGHRYVPQTKWVSALGSRSGRGRVATHVTFSEFHLMYSCAPSDRSYRNLRYILFDED